MKLVCFSGGLDSTYLVKKAFEDNVEFKTIYFNLENNKYLAKHEIRARKKILAYLQSEYPQNGFKGDLIYDFGIIPINTDIDVAMYQSFVWTTFLVSLCPKDVDVIEMAYVMYDDFWHIRDRALKSFETLWKTYRLTDTAPKIVYPLEWKYKAHIAKVMGMELNMVFSCENPILGKPCGECYSCTRHKDLS